MSQYFLKFFLLPAAVFIVLFTPQLWSDGIVSAAGLVPCGGPNQVACQFCHLAVLADNAVNFVLFALAVPISSLLFAYAGFLYVVQGVREDSIKKAKSILISTVVGLVFALAAWLVVTTVVNNLVTDELKIAPHARFECVSAQPLPTYNDSSAVTPTVPSAQLDPSCVHCQTGYTCTTCQSIPQNIPLNANPCAGGPANCQLSTAIAQNIVSLNNDLQTQGITWRVSEAWPPTRTHSNSCHSLGTCIDASLGGSASASQINSFIAAADRSGMRAVYEVATAAERNALISQGVPAASIAPPLGSHISGPHFSVYKK